MAVPKKKSALNIFSILASLNKKKTGWYDDMSDEEKKAVQPVMLQRWMSGTSDPAQVVMTNEFVNRYVFPLFKHQKLLVELMSVASSGSGNRVKWIKAKGKRTSATPITTAIIKQTYGYNTRDAIEVLPILSDADILEMAADLGKQPDDIRAIKAELKKR